MVASVDLNRYEPPLEYLLARVERLVRLLDGHVDPGFVRRESGELLQEVCEFCRSRLNFAGLETKLRAARAIDIDSVEAALRLIERAPRQPAPNQHDPQRRFETLRSGIATIRENQHRWQLVETLLRLEIGFESIVTSGLIAIVDDWQPEPLIRMVRAKLANLNDRRLHDLWSRVIEEFRVDDDSPEDEGYVLVDHGVLPKGFLEPNPDDVLDRLAIFHAWLRSRVIRAMLRAGQTTWPIPGVGIVKILASNTVTDDPTPTELTIARAVGNIAGWLALRGEPMTVDQFAGLLRIEADSHLVSGQHRLDFEAGKGAWQGDALERAALYSFASLASSVASTYETQTPMAIALFQYKAGIELFAPSIARTMSRSERTLQRELIKFLLERGIFSVGTTFGQNETDLVANVRQDYIVVECKVLKSPPSVVALQRNLAQLLRYDSLNPAFRGRRAVLVLFNFADVPILTPQELVGGRAWIIAINLKAGPPSKTIRCLSVEIDREKGVRCTELGGARQRRSPRRPSRARP